MSDDDDDVVRPISMACVAKVGADLGCERIIRHDQNMNLADPYEAWLPYIAETLHNNRWPFCEISPNETSTLNLARPMHSIDDEECPF